MKSKLISLLVLVLVCAALTGGCWGCVRVYHWMGSPPPTAEEKAHAKLMLKELTMVERGDIVVVNYPFKGEIGFVRWHSHERKEVGIALVSGVFLRIWTESEDWGLKIPEVIRHNDPRWATYRDRAIFSDALDEPASQPAK